MEDDAKVILKGRFSAGWRARRDDYGDRRIDSRK